MVKIDKLQMIPINARLVKLVGPVLDLHRDYQSDGKTIERLYREDGWTCGVGDTIYPRDKYPHKVNLIYPQGNNGRIAEYDLVTAAVNTSSIFCMPFLGGNRKLFMWDQLFLNCFIGTTPENTRKVIALLYRFSGEPLFLKFESALCAFRNFIKRYDPDPYHVMFIFDVPSEAVMSYEHYVHGRYSEIDDIWKLKILEWHGFDIDGHTGKILFKADSLKQSIEDRLGVALDSDSELHSIPSLETEVFNPDYYLPIPPGFQNKIEGDVDK
jgi:hypothetical protein